MTHELKDLLEEAVQDVTAPDLGATAWDAAQGTRRRRRLVAAVATAAAAAVVVAAMVLPGATDGLDTLPGSGPTTTGPTPSATGPTPSATGPQPWRAAPVDLLGVAAVFGPTAAEAASLPRVDAETALALGLPESLAPTTSQVRAWSKEQGALVAGGDATAPVTAVVLRRGDTGSVFPVVYRPTLERPWLEADTLPLVPVRDSGGNQSDPLRDRAIAPDGRQVAFAQPGKVVVLDVVTAQVRTIAVDDPFLEDVGWNGDGSVLVARSSGRQWRVDPTTQAVTLFGDPAYAGRHEVVVSGDETLLRTERSLALMDEGRRLPGIFAATWGETISGPGNRVAVGGSLSPATEATAPTVDGTVPYQGVLTVTADTLDDPAILLAPPSEEAGLGKGCCRALRWLDPDRLLLVWDRDLLVWDGRARTITRASVRPVGAESEAPGTLTGSFAVAP
ncbi:hypothetical protein [Knoellia sp. LjRoot47]|uniref:hypothetical protein n=1 Tax=Knoellia sp. LjRoot47 TaxID=3342330 RepID=UPI003ECF4253